MEAKACATLLNVGVRLAVGGKQPSPVRISVKGRVWKAGLSLEDLVDEKVSLLSAAS